MVFSAPRSRSLEGSWTSTGSFLGTVGATHGRRLVVASDIFAKIGDIKGESLDDKHKDEIEVLSWSWGVSSTGVRGGGVGGGAGKASIHDLSFTHKIDK